MSFDVMPYIVSDEPVQVSQVNPFQYQRTVGAGVPVEATENVAVPPAATV
jgi:hypothetical protein